MLVATARYGSLRETTEVKTTDETYRAYDKVVIRTDRGRELGELLTKPTEIPEGASTNGRELVRKANKEDFDRDTENQEMIPGIRKFAREQIEKLELSMKLVDIEKLLGGEKVIFYFVSEERVDFRELVKVLGQEYRARIEMKQVGARDEAKLCGDCGHCGLTLCCRNHLKDLGGVSMDMAKLQKQTVDPSKVCGLCGKLLCCLKYEYKIYTEARKVFPSRGKDVETPFGRARVLSHNIILGDVIVGTHDGRQVVHIDTILEMNAPGAKKRQAQKPAEVAREKVQKETERGPREKPKAEEKGEKSDGGGKKKRRRRRRRGKKKSSDRSENKE